MTTKELTGLKRPFKPIAAWQRVEEALRMRITDGVWPVGSMIPTRRALTEELGVDLSTVQRAIGALITDGLLRASPRHGTFVSDHLDRVPIGGSVPVVHLASRDTKRSHTPRILGQLGPVGVMVSHAHPNPWDIKVIDAAEKQLSSDGVVVVDAARMDAAVAEGVTARVQVRQLLTNGCSGVIVVALNEEDDFAHDVMAGIGGTSLPVVFITSVHIEGPISHVYWSGYDAGYMAAEHLLSEGWRRLGFAGHAHVIWVDERYEGACQAVKTYSGSESLVRQALAPRPTAPGGVNFCDVPVKSFVATGNPLVDGPDPGHAANYRTYVDSGIAAGKALLEGPDQVDGIIAANDAIACGVIEAGSKLGLRVGLDFAVVGFDNEKVARERGITSIDRPLVEMGAEAARHTIERLTTGSAAKAVRLQSILLSRLSTSRSSSESLVLLR